MEPANPGFTLISKQKIFKHCGSGCKKLIDEAPQCSVKILPPHHTEHCLILLSIQSCLETTLYTQNHTVIHVTVCISLESNFITHGRPYALIKLLTKEYIFFSLYLADDFSPVEPIDVFPPSFSFKTFKDSNILPHVLQMSLQHSDISSITQLLCKAMEINPSLAGKFHLMLNPTYRYGCIGYQ